MKLFIKIALSLILSCPSAYGALFSISEADINQTLAEQLAEKVPARSVGFPPLFKLDYQIQQLETQIGRSEAKKVDVITYIDGKLTGKGRTEQITLRLKADTLPYLNTEKGAIFLKETRIIDWSVTPNKYQRELHMIMPLLSEGVTQLLNTIPVYTLDESQAKEALIKRFGKAIHVERGELRLETGIF